MSIYKPTWLYIKQHNQTGLKYFGKTSSKDPIKYSGSGEYWLAHLRKHGKDVSTIWCHLYLDKETLVEEAMAFSTSHNIINAIDNHTGKKIWANKILENGLGTTKGANSGIKRTFTEEHKKNIANASKLRRHSIATRQKMSEAHLGKVVSAETRDKISKIHKGKIVSSETRNKMSASLSGLVRSDEIKARMVELGRQKRWWNNGCSHTLSVTCPVGWSPGRLR
jgi:hypothetical protein